MSGHRVELRISFTVGDENGRAEAEGVVRHLESMVDHGELDRYTDDFTVTRGTVDGNSWYECWPKDVIGTAPPWLSQPFPNEPFSPMHLRVLDGYCAELGIDPARARQSWVTMVEAVRWWNASAPELYKGPTLAGEELAKYKEAVAHGLDGDPEWEAILVRNDRQERLNRMMPNPTRPYWRASRSKHAPAVEERTAIRDSRIEDTHD